MTNSTRLGLLLLTCPLLSIGCGQGVDPGPERFQVSGKVTFDGQPLQRGSIQFLPAEGNSGPEGFARIEEGVFDTKLEGNSGHVGGPMLVKIKAEGPISEDDEPTKPPFEIWGTELDLPKSDSEQNFEVPKEAANPKPVRQRSPEV